MPTLPSATIQIQEVAGGSGALSDMLCVFGCCAKNADMVPRVFASTEALLSTHGYCDALEYAALHFQGTRKPIVFVPLPITTASVNGSIDTSGNSGYGVGWSVSGAAKTEIDGIVTIVNSGTVGTNPVIFDLSLDGGRTSQRCRVATGTLTYTGFSHATDSIGFTLTVGATGDTFVAGEVVLRWHSTAPMWASADLATARAKLAAQQRGERDWLVVEPVTPAFAGYAKTQVEAYETSNARYKQVRVNTKDRLPVPTMSKKQTGMPVGSGLTFAEVGATGDTIALSPGSFSSAFATGEWVRVRGSVSNNVQGKLATGAAALLTFDTTDLINEGPITTADISAEATLTFAEVGSTGDTITRSSGSWLEDGFASGDYITITGTASNNLTSVKATTVAATVITLDTGDLVNETIGICDVTIVKADTPAMWIASMADAHTMDATKRVSIGAGQARVVSPVTSWEWARPVSWFASIRSHAHDVHIPTYRADDGPISGADLFDKAGNLEQFDERTIGGALNGRFTCFTTMQNGPNGAFIGLDLTRDTEGKRLSRQHNMQVVNVACTTVHAATTRFIGQVPQLNSDGTAIEEWLNKLESSVNDELQSTVLVDKGEGPRASGALWTASRLDNLSVVGATLNGTLALTLNGVVENVATVAKIG